MVNELTGTAIDDSQRTAARVAGFMYLFLMVTGVVAFSARSGLIVAGDPTKTAGNIMASERLFRITTALDLITAAGEAVLAVALYVLLKRINPSLALLAALWRVMDGAILGVITICSFVMLLLLSGSPYLQVFRTDQLHALVSLFYNAEGAGFTLAFVFLASGAAVFNYLLFESRYVPRALAAWGIFSYVVMLVGTLAGIVVRNFADAAVPIWYAPAGIFEIVTGFWLLFKGVDSANWGWFAAHNTEKP